MVFHRETRRSQLIYSCGACLDFEHSLASFAQEVMMVMRVLSLVVRRSTGYFHDVNVTLIHQDTESAVYCCDA
jgi:hypothetical protein